jgi:hypothetical protein
MQSGCSARLGPSHLSEGSYRPVEQMTDLPRTCGNGERTSEQAKLASRGSPADSPLLILPIRHVMGISHYVSQQELS